MCGNVSARFWLVTEIASAHHALGMNLTQLGRRADVEKPGLTPLRTPIENVEKLDLTPPVRARASSLTVLNCKIRPRSSAAPMLKNQI